MNILFLVIQFWHWPWVRIGLSVLAFSCVSLSIAEDNALDVLTKQKIRNAIPFLPDESPILTLRGAIQLTLQHNPELTAFGKEVSALKGITLQAGLLPNPELMFDVEDVGARKNGPGGEFASIRIGQLIEIGGKRAARSNVASLGQEQASQVYEARRLDLISQVANVFTSVLSGQKRLQLAEARKDLAQNLVNIARKRVQVGKAPPLEETKSKIVLATTKIELKQVQRDLHTARKQLTLLWGNPMPKFERVSGNLESFVTIPPFGVLEERIRVNPTVLASRINLAQRKAQLKLEKARRIPDVTVNAGVRRYSRPNDTTALFALSVPLPLFDRNQGNILAAQQRVGKAKDDWAATDLQMKSLLVQTYEDLLAVNNEIGLLRDEILPGARDAFAIAQRGYELGKFGFLEMLDAQRTLFQNQTLYLRALTNYQRLINEIERLIAAPIEKSQDLVK